MKFLKSIIVVSLLAINSLFGDVAEMIINEIMYKQQGNGADNNDEFVEFYVTKSGDIGGYVFSDQDGGSSHIFTFPTHNVSEGDYVILHLGTDDGAGESASTTGTHIHHFDMNKTRMLNDPADDVVLLQPSENDRTNIDGVWVDAIPFDYVAYGKKTSSTAIDDPPVSEHNVTVTWDYGNGENLDGVQSGTSISLSTNGDDGDTSYCWEITTSGGANNAHCPDYKPTLDTNDNVNDNGDQYIASGTDNNNGMPDMHITKTSIVINDPVNDDSNPKRIPGAIIRYCFTVDNNGTGNAQNATIHDSLTGSGREHLGYKASGSTPAGNISTACDCADINTTNGTISGTDVTIDLGDINGTGDTAHSRACAYIKVEIK